MCTIACPGVSLTLLAVAWHCGFALRVFMRVLSHGWIEGLTTHHRWRRQLLFFNATQSWRTLLWFLKKHRANKHILKKQKPIHHITKIHVDTGQNPCPSKEMELTFLGTWGGDWWTKPYWEIWGECIMSGEGLSRMCAVEIKTPINMQAFIVLTNK